ncbi:TPA: transketolase family protein [Candidatus Woesearchaeota archaeon]|nr:transketolase family protein [Candidatus Woesearchaeota archaeon]
MTDLHQLKNLNKSLHLNFFRERIPTRNGYGEGLLQVGKDKRIMVLCADLVESTRVLAFKEKYPQQFIEVGVAEQNLVTVAAGLSAVGKIPFVSSYAVFCPGRCWEQIRTTICYNNRNVKIIGAHAGISVGPDGATHQMLEDIAIMRSLPNMVVVVPADYEQTKKATQAIAAYKGPAYMRFAREKTEQMTTTKTPFQIGKAQVLTHGNDLTIIAAGPVLYECLRAAAQLEQKNIHVSVINCHTIKPLDGETILTAVRQSKKVITVEEAQITGGLGGAVTEFLAEHYPVPVKRIGVRDHFGESGEPQELLEQFGFSARHIYKEALSLLGRKR